MLNPALVRNADAIRERFASAAPFPHVVLDDFLQPEAASKLADEFPPFESGNFIGDDGKPGRKSTLARVHGIGASYRALDQAIQSSDFLQFMSRLTGIEHLLYDPFYLGGGTHENLNGSALDPHIDFNYHPSERWHRRLNLLLYLNPQWAREWGGCLHLYADPRVDASPSVTVVPVFNRCVIFETSERSWHGFDEIRLPPDDPRVPASRRSIALYFYTRERPREETADRHSTVYQHRPLASHFVAGHTLTAHDVEELHAVLAQRDAYIDMQHAENRRLLQAQEHGLAGQILYLMKRAYVRFRR